MCGRVWDGIEFGTGVCLGENDGNLLGQLLRMCSERAMEVPGKFLIWILAGKCGRVASCKFLYKPRLGDLDRPVVGK